MTELFIKDLQQRLDRSGIFEHEPYGKSKSDSVSSTHAIGEEGSIPKVHEGGSSTLAIGEEGTIPKSPKHDLPHATTKAMYEDGSLPKPEPQPTTKAMWEDGTLPKPEPQPGMSLS